MLCLLCNALLLKFVIFPLLVAFGVKFLIKKLRGKIDPTNEIDISGKTVIVTGASDGIGKVTAEEFAVRGARVIMACRNVQKGEKCVEEIRSRTSNGQLIVMHLDLSKMSSVRKFVEEFAKNNADHQGLSILVNNAGLRNPVGVLNITEDGFEEVLGVNHLGHFLLTNLLLPHLEKAGRVDEAQPSRIVTVSSGAHRFGQLNWHDLNFRKTPFVDWKFPPKLYGNSKLANCLFNVELAKKLRLKKMNVTCYALCPGVVNTDSAKQYVDANPPPLPIRIVYRGIKFFMGKPLKEGTETTMYCSLSKYLTHHSGEMYRNCEFWDPSKRPKLSEEDAKLLWEESAKLVKLE
ncbi:retinol dehydrogenase 12 [Folsomia candida]|uniref:Retinol dehydrogenase 12 n=1 Tax=Folsomia candida TaxID=158441 RepID=A0A226DVK4_FOLCA|nr:retinol dehydrogenase 12 [Folsomia candida]OXA48727.1 Retinol dehydrogenase 12 [Folsomia candida]